MEKKQIILPTKRFANADLEDIDIRLNLDEQKNLLREGDKNIVLDVDQLFNKERNESRNYKIHGKIKMIFRNMYSGTTSYEPLNKNLYLVGDGLDGDITGFLPYNEFAFLRNDVLREVVDPTSVTGSTLDSYSPSIVLTGYTGHTTITTIDAPYHNWNIYLSYVYSGDTNHPMKYTLSGNTIYSFVSGDGIPFRITSGTTYTTLTSPVEHGLSKGEYLLLSGQTEPIYITDLGNEIYNSEKYVLNILNNDIPTGTTLTDDTVVLGKRCIDKNNISGTTSQYYVHKHKILTSNKDYVMDKVGFESPIWEDEKKILFENPLGENDVIVERNRMESVIYDFKEPFVLTGLTNNLGYTPTDLYVTILLRNGNGYFDYPPKVGWKFNFHDTWIDQHFSGTTQTDEPFEVAMGTGTTITSNLSGTPYNSGTILSIGTSGLTGAFIEYNESELKERVISDAFHKFTIPTSTFDHRQDDDSVFEGSSVDNPHGLFYQPYHRVKIRQLSPYIETSDTDEIVDLPENVKYFENEGLWKWRDLYDQGFVDQDGYGTNYPFINNIHYIKNDINFYLRSEKDYTNKSDGIKKFDTNIC
jgi:hypothetical protein